MKNVLNIRTLIVGSGAAGLAAAIALHRRGVHDLLIATESLTGGTSINTGSDKQTYYKLSLCGADADSIQAMAETYFAGGSMHGDLALVEAANSVRAFMNLVDLGLPFPKDAFGQFVGYKTDHDPRQRATSIGPYTSREMCTRMIARVRELQIPVRENVFLKELLVAPISDKNVEDSAEPCQKRVYGATFFASGGRILTVLAQNVIFAVGGPGGLYAASVYPKVHLGAIGVALRAGAVAQNLPESQFGLASTAFRWNVSGTFMQVLPRFISTAADGVSDEREFLEDYSAKPGDSLPLVFLKGYQWPFDARKTVTPDGFGSSMVDIWVYVETVLKNRRVFLDFRTNPLNVSRETVGETAWTYLQKSGAWGAASPLERLKIMNPAAIQLYADHGIDLTREPLEIAVCAQHNNGGLAADADWQSLNIRGLFPIGEVNGSHGVYRPGGSALNSGQVGALRAAEFIAKKPKTSEFGEFTQTLEASSSSEAHDWREARRVFQSRMSRAGGFLRNLDNVQNALRETRQEISTSDSTTPEAFRNSYLLETQEFYLDAIRFQLECGVGSRGSAIVLENTAPGTNCDGAQALELGPETYRIVPENEDYRNFVLESWRGADGEIHHRWVPRREIPHPDSWFENVWKNQRNA